MKIQGGIRARDIVLSLAVPFVCVSIIGVISNSMMMTDLNPVRDKLIHHGSLIISSIMGFVFLRKLKIRTLIYVGIVYFPIMYIALLYYVLTFVGIVYGLWL